MLEQAEIEPRDDVLVYTSASLGEPVVVVGPVEVRLFAASSARDTDFPANWLMYGRPARQITDLLFELSQGGPQSEYG